MPTYQYACTECGHRFEEFQSFTEDALTTCPECSGRLRKVFNAVGVVFKGSGFYRTDSRAAASSSSASSNGGGSNGSASNGSSSKGSAVKGADSGSAGPRLARSVQAAVAACCAATTAGLEQPSLGRKANQALGRRNAARVQSTGARPGPPDAHVVPRGLAGGKARPGADLNGRLTARRRSPAYLSR